MRRLHEWLEAGAVRAGLRVPVDLSCDFCSRTVRSVDRVEAVQLSELGWLPCTCGGSAFPVLPAEVPL